MAEELKKEAEEYVKQNYCEMCVMSDDCKSGCIDCFTVQAYIASAEPREKQIAELERENAELKEQKKMLEQGFVWHDYDAGEDCYEDTHEGKWVKRDEVYQLTKAKEIIKTFLGFAEAFGYSPSMDKFITEAEQFLKDSEVEK